MEKTVEEQSGKRLGRERQAGFMKTRKKMSQRGQGGLAMPSNTEMPSRLRLGKKPRAEAISGSLMV